MNKKTLYLALVAILIVQSAHAKKSRRAKRPKDDDSTPQPNVVTYSNFGFNDVGTYDGFVPSSPEFPGFVSSRTRDSATRLYAPAFPTAMDTIGYNNFGTSSQDGQYDMAEDNTPQASMLQYPQSTMNFYSGSGMDASETQSRNNVASEEIYRQNAEDVNSPIYGTKLGSKSHRPEFNRTDHIDVNVYGGGANTMEVKYSTYHEVPSTHETKPSSFGEQNNNYQNSYQYNYAPTYPSNTESYMKSATTTTNPLKFPKVIDFTKYKSYYPSELESKLTSTSTKSPVSYNSGPDGNDNNFNNFETQNNKYTHQTSLFNNEFVNKDEEDVVQITEKPVTKPTYTHSDFAQNYLGHSNKNTLKDSKYLEYKDKFKYNTSPTTNYSTDYKNWKSPFKGYQYTSDYSNTTFEFDFSGVKKPSSNVQSNSEDYIPASSNTIDLTHPRHPQPETDYSSFKKFPGLKGAYSQNYDSYVKSLKTPEYDPEEYVRSIYSTIPTTATNWGNVYKTSEFSSFKNHPKKPSQHYGDSIDNFNDDTIHIPKKPYGGNKLNYGKYTDSKISDWSSLPNYRPYKSKKNKETTRFKSEEDLLGLRNHDTSHPSNLPTYRPAELGDDFDYKKFVEKWRQSYLKAKYGYNKDIAMLNDFDPYQSETKQMQHVPIPKPYPIEIPHPVIVPVPQPYAVQVPVPKPVAIPVIQELKIPIEKPVPYPVIKKVPYPVEKPVPVKVEKEVAVPVVKPYPVAIPHIRPVFHHSRLRDEDDSYEEEEEYLPRPESSKRVPYVKKIKSIRHTRVRPSRPSRTFIHERNRRRWPSKRPHTASRKPHSIEFRSPAFRHHSYEEDDDRDYIAYCKKTGYC